MVSISNTRAEPAGVANDDPPFFASTPRDDRSFGSCLPNGFPQRHPGRLDGHCDFGGGGNELFQALILISKSILERNTDALLNKFLPRHAGELTEGPEPSTGGLW